MKNILRITYGIIFFVSVFSCSCWANEIDNYGFEEGLKGWNPLWTKDAGVGIVTLDSQEKHAGSNSVRIEHSGEHDWSFSLSSEKKVKEGDIYLYSAWLKKNPDGKCDVRLCVVTKDAQGKAVDWFYAAQTLRVSEEWREVQAAFVIPAGVVRILPRISGSGKGKIWADDFSLKKTGSISQLRQGNLPESLTLNNRILSVAFDPEKATFLVTDLRSQKKYEQKAITPQVVVLEAKSSENEIRMKLLFVTTFLKMDAVLRLEKELPEMVFELSAEGELSTSIPFPHPFISEVGERWIVPMNEGIAYPVEDETIPKQRLVAYAGHGICMSFWGSTDGERGVMSIFETPDDAAIRLSRDEKKLYIAPEWEPQRGEWGYTRRLRYVFFDKGGYVAMAKRYRDYAKKIGIFKTLSQKRDENPNVDLLIGAANIWCWENDAVALAKEMQSAGMEKLLWSNAKEPDDIRKMNALGILTSRYDIYQDAMNPENFKLLRYIHPEWTSDGWPKDIVVDANGQWVHGWGVETKDGGMVDCGVLCDKQAIEYARRRITANLKTHPYTCRFIDTTTAATLKECFNPAHPMSRTDSRNARAELLRYISEEKKLVLGSETGHELAVPYLHYFEGMLSLTLYRVPDSGRHMEKIWDQVPEGVAKFQVGHEYRIPLWELVFHDCVVAQWYWGDYNNKLPSIWDKRDLFNILYGTPPMYMFNREMWKKNKDRFVKSYQNTCPYVRKVGYSEMTDHCYLTQDRSVQQTTFANGVKITVNFGDKPFVTSSGESIGAMAFHFEEK